MYNLNQVYELQWKRGAEKSCASVMRMRTQCLLCNLSLILQRVKCPVKKIMKMEFKVFYMSWYMCLCVCSLGRIKCFWILCAFFMGLNGIIWFSIATRGNSNKNRRNFSQLILHLRQRVPACNSWRCYASKNFQRVKDFFTPDSNDTWRVHFNFNPVAVHYFVLLFLMLSVRFIYLFFFSLHVFSFVQFFEINSNFPVLVCCVFIFISFGYHRRKSPKTYRETCVQKKKNNNNNRDERLLCVPHTCIYIGCTLHCTPHHLISLRESVLSIIFSCCCCCCPT